MNLALAATDRRGGTALLASHHAPSMAGSSHSVRKSHAASACSAPAQLTTEQTCDRIKIVVTNPSASAGKTGMNILANRLRPIISGASDELKPSVKAIVAWADESAKESPDAEKLKALTADYQKAGTTFGQLCS